jgi:nucleotide-binding universal stress UspA family protein
MGALTQNLFTMIVAMAVTTTMVMPPMLRWGLSKVPMSRSEKQRLEREEIEARGFVPNIERLLLAVDDSPNGRFASRLAGLIAGPRGMPITVVPLGEDESSRADKKKRSQSADDAKQAAASAARNGKKSQAERKPRLDVTVRKSEGSDHDAVAEEAEKGYDLLLIGLDRMRGRSGRFNPDIERSAADFEGPLAIVEAKGAHHEQPEQSDLDIVVPVNGSQIAQRGAEVAIAIARVVRAPLRAIYVSETAGRNRSGRSGMRARWHEQAILKDIVELADMADLDIKTAVRAGRPAADAILSEVGRNADKLIVMGVARPSGELFLGEIAAAVLEKSPASILLISS